MQRLTEYYDGEARVIRIDHKEAFAKLAAYEDTELTPEDVAEMKLELLATRSRLVDAEKALKGVCEFFHAEWGCPTEYDIHQSSNICTADDCNTKEDSLKCWERYWAQKARGGSETSDIQNRQR